MRLPVTKIGSDGAHTFELDACLHQQFEMCAHLEKIADALPSRIDTQAAVKIAHRLQETLRRCHRMEEKIVFPLLLRLDPQKVSILERLRIEHLEDQDHASDVSHAIREYVLESKRREAEELGYMLRCLFVSLRRHLAFDRDYILPLYIKAVEI